MLGRVWQKGKGDVPVWLPGLGKVVHEGLIFGAGVYLVALDGIVRYEGGIYLRYVDNCSIFVFDCNGTGI